VGNHGRAALGIEDLSDRAPLDLSNGEIGGEDDLCLSLRGPPVP
jgi:hypothetical protein